MTLRQSMAGLHTWGGLLPSWLLFVILFAGTLACFDKELERWMRPALHEPVAGSMTADDVSAWLRANVHETLHAYWMHGPTERAPYWKLGWEEDASEVRGKAAFDPRTGEPMPETVGGDFFFTLHYNLQAGTPGMYIVGLAGMFMLVALVSGTIVHRRLFKDFFTLRPQANGQRAWLDAHNLFGVIGLPFHLVLAYTGVAVFVSFYMPAGAKVAYGGDPLAFFHEVQGGYHRNELDRPAEPPVPLSGLLADARQRWGGAELGWIVVEHPSDASAVVSVRRFDPSRIGAPQDALSYDATTGELLHQQQAPAGYRAYTWLAGLHMAQFGGQLVRILYGLLGLAGCAMLVAGTGVWLRKREARDGRGVALVRGLNGAVFFGLPIACLALLWANRLLPETLSARGAAEGWAFSLGWMAVALLALGWRRTPARLTRTLLALSALLALGLPVLNGLTMPDGHLPASLARGDLALAGVDLVLLAVGALCAWRAWRRKPEPRDASLPTEAGVRTPELSR
ncbi:PepSY-associated TM helix domain-containing protein [Stutzerimonas azotifigens]|uniref:PepSY-associated TM helix domain-containing protein n=1 Tax=Stutzerimonas azotifigens TaxID=291995 RepID=UPI0003FD57F9|nr:PepSY-associated TM helix domain-containing protein [Stutzerimonas azotifigens]